MARSTEINSPILKEKLYQLINAEMDSDEASCFYLRDSRVVHPKVCRQNCRPHCRRPQQGFVSSQHLDVHWQDGVLHDLAAPRQDRVLPDLVACGQGRVSREPAARQQGRVLHDQVASQRGGVLRDPFALRELGVLGDPLAHRIGRNQGAGFALEK